MEAITVTESDTTVVTEATWKPGLPPPIEALQRKFPPETGYTIEYATWLERDQADASGWRHIPIAIVTMPDGKEITFFPTRPQSPDRGSRGCDC
jgi:hypothetical protein